MSDTLSSASDMPPSLAPQGSWIKHFLVGVGQSWKKITWPTKGQLFIQVLITIAVTTFATTLVWGMDTVFRFLIQTFVIQQ
jgi:preprotein translocase SecE subunit